MLNKGGSNGTNTRGGPEIQPSHVMTDSSLHCSCIRQFDLIRSRHPSELSTLWHELLRRRIAAPK
eukprot:231403-Pelagomonas_calceolata.AAC.1